MGCGSSQAAGIKNGREFTSLDIADIQKEPENEVVTIDEIVASYPPPKPDSKKKRQIFTEEDSKLADSRALLIKAESVLTMEELAEKLTSDLQKDVQRLRALFTWIGLQQISTKQFPANTGENTLLHHMKRVKERQMSYSTFFTMLCRAAQIPCVIIRGLAKSVAYEVGDQEVDGCGNSWTAAYVAGGWRFVFPLWAFSAVSGFQTGKWTLVETEGKGVREKEKESEGMTLSQINEYYFLTDPEALIYVCFPNDEAWQLLTTPFSKRQFIDVPFFKQAYFEHDVKVTSTMKSVLNSKDALCDISLRSGFDTRVSFKYELYYNHEESKKPISDDIQLDRYVACLNQEKSNIFKIRFPCEGIFKIEIFGVFDNDSFNRMLCAFKLICNETISDVKPFPCNPSSGFGPSKTTEENGLVSPTQKTGFIRVRKERNINFKFKMVRSVQVQAVLVHNQISSEELQHNVTQKVKGNELSVDVNIPNSEEYALQINTRDKGSKGDFKNACNYLISSSDTDKKRKKRSYENALEKRARKGLEECLTSRDPEAIQKALDEFQKHDLQDPKRVQKAEQKKTYHMLAQGENIEKLERAIDNATSSEFEEKLSNLIQSAEDLLQHLNKLKKYSHDVLQMSKPTISEITNYKYPIPLAYDIMKATYLLLGEKERSLQEWDMITSLMRKTGKQGLLHRVQNYDTLHSEENSTNKAAKLLRQYTEDETKKASVGIATFYVWITIDEIVPSYPPPKPDSKKKIHIFTDEDAKIADSRATLIKAESVLSMTDLAEKLTSGLQKDIQRLRALFTWMGLQRISAKQYPTTTGENTLLYHMKRVKERFMSYSIFFIMLCRSAKIPCVMIRGLAKSVAYEVGDQDIDDCTNHWTAAYVAGGWRFVFPLWAFSARSGYQAGKWTLVETEGKNAWEKRARKGLEECLTSKDPETIQKALDEFQKHDLQDPEIVMRAEKKKTYHILAQGNFFHKKIFNLRDAINTRNIERLEKAIDHASSSEFEVKLSNLIKSAEELLQHLRKLKRFSHEVLKMSKPTISEITNYKYPIPLAYDIMKATYLLLGEKERNLQKWEMITNLMRKTGKEALLRRIHNYDTLNAEQNITNQAAKLLRQYTEDDTKKASVGIATFYVWITIDEIVSSYPPPRPDSKKKSQIFTEDDAKIADSRATLIKAESVLSMEELAEKLTSGLQKDVQRLARSLHMDGTATDQAAKIPCVLIRGLAKSAAYEVGDQELDGCGNCWTAVYLADGWRFVFPLWAFSAISGYHTGKWTLVETEDLRDAINTRNIEKLEKAIQHASSSEFEVKLSNLIKSAEELLQHLRKLKRFSHEVLKMSKPTISEITNYKYPRPLAYDIMKATYLLLGEREHNLQEWEMITGLMRRTGKEGLLRRVRNYDTLHSEENITNQAAKLLRQYTEDETKKASVGIATFYVWVRTLSLSSN
ncbi:hypothetical protein FSP39_019873 [Pinctada imbricata]|uniref:KY-like immunoglobulin-like domain-containing protein n=1 Tax=Pinctada imbricata TaxID=66713 RepID=A0AA88Y5V8_PINIB|nr:hypothetical protein FSP39_019873 [Pinctada imbricata]